MNHIYVRPLRVHDESDMAACRRAFEQSGAYIPEESFSWPSTRVLVAEKSGAPVLYQPVRSVYLLGSLGKVSGITDLELASAQHQITAAVFYESQKAGNGELIFMGGNTQTESFALRHQFEEYPHRLFRMKVL